MIILLPNLLDPDTKDTSLLPLALKEEVNGLRGLFAESEKAARHYLLLFMDREKMQGIQIELLNEHTDEKDLKTYLSLIEKGEKWGVVSDAGLPCVADPGAHLVYLAHQNNIKVSSIPGPSSIMMALVASGLCGQNFAFHGYLPRKEHELLQALESLEKKAYIEKSTQIWIEAPYRSQKMIDICIRALKPTTLFSISQNLTMENEAIQTYSIAQWKNKKVQVLKEPCVFLIAAPYLKK